MDCMDMSRNRERGVKFGRKYRVKIERQLTHHAYINEKRHALDMWAAELMRIVDGDALEHQGISIISAVA
jgi:hypothetical protein